jgi:hypothetical protein
MRQYEFDAHRWSRIKNDELLLDCVVTSRRSGWIHAGYQVRLYVKGHLMYQSRLYLARKLANDEADALLRETMRSVGQHAFVSSAQAKSSRNGTAMAVVAPCNQQPSR